jgi:hypothetical protein
MPPPENLYSQDFSLWLLQQASLVRSGRVLELDRANLAEEIEALERRERGSLHENVATWLELTLLRMVNQEHGLHEDEPAEIALLRSVIRLTIKDSPSLLPLVQSCLQAEYPAAVDAARATALKAGIRARFPKVCPFTFESIRGHL